MTCCVLDVQPVTAVDGKLWNTTSLNVLSPNQEPALLSLWIGRADEDDG